MFASVTSVVPYFALSGLLLGFAAIVSRRSRFFRHLLDAEGASGRFHAIDGLRGFLALAVFFHHAVIAHHYYLHGRWDLDSRFYAQLGGVGVALFFMITAFLFWRKGLEARPFLRVHSMLWSRICRLAPMFFFSILTALFIAFAVSGFEARVPLKTLIVQALTWLSFGTITAYDFNGVHDAWTINGRVQWSLAYEWAFYLFLPLGLIFARGRGFLLLASVASVLIQAFSARPAEWNFVFGALAAVLLSRGLPIPAPAWRSPLLGAVVLGVLALVLTGFDTAYGPLQAALLFVAFMCIANGNDLLGLLTSRPARLLGAISYSIYLMHAIVLFVVLRLANALLPVAAMPAPTYWLLILSAGLATVALSAATYRAIEHPFMRQPMPQWLDGASAASSEVVLNEGAGGSRP